MGSFNQVKIPYEKHVVFFDGVCNLCNRSINFIIDRDVEGLFIFSSLQSPQAEGLIPKELFHGVDSIIVRTKNGEWLSKSDAVLFIAAHIKGWLSFFKNFSIIPKAIRDVGYSLVAKSRYKIFGQRDSCRMPSSELANRFLETYQKD